MEITFAGSGVAIGIIFAVVIMKYYQSIRLFFADITSFLFFAGHGVKKFSLENEIESAINLMAKEFNKEMAEPLLPQCKIEWVKSEDQKTYFNDGEAIVCLNFDKQDRNKDVYNALYSFVKTGLIAQTKPFIKEETSKGIDLLVTKSILKKTRPKILQTFNEHFSQEQYDCRQRFYTLEDIEDNGFFQSILVPELKQFGDVVFTKTPNDKIQHEGERFVDWLHSLVMRERGEDTLLYFNDNNIKVGVILVADSEIYDQHGLNAYIRRAYLYASEGYPCVYLCSSGNQKSKVTVQISDVLTSNEHFTKLNKKSNIVRYDEAGSQYLITCISLKINHDIISYDFWEEIENAQKMNKTIKAEIQNVREDSVTISYLCNQYEIPINRLSKIEIYDTLKHFNRHDILSLRVVSFEKETNVIEFTNEETDTDPAGLIEENLSSDLPFAVKKILKSKAGYEFGLSVYNLEKKIYGFVPREYAVTDRFTLLSGKYNVGQTIQLEVRRYDSARNNYICKVKDLTNPWENIPSSSIEINKTVKATIKEIRHSCILCLISEGIEGELSVSDLSWSTPQENRSKLKKLKIGDIINVKVTGIDKDRKIIELNKRILEGSPTVQFFGVNKSKIVEGVIERIQYNGIEIKLSENVFGFIYMSEVSWFYVNDLTDRYKSGERIKVLITDYNEKFQNLLCSIKAAEKNDFDVIISEINNNAVVTGEVLRFLDDKAEIRIEYNGNIGYGFVHKSELSNIMFITEDLYSQILIPGNIYSFLLLSTNASFKTFTLSRKAYYQKAIESIEYGTEYHVNVVQTPANVYVYSDDMEGFLIGDHRIVSPKITVLPSSIKSNSVEVYCSEQDK